MAFVAVSLSVGTAIGLGTGTAAILGGGALIGAGIGGAYSAITKDGNVLNSMLTGGLLGGAGAYGLGAMEQVERQCNLLWLVHSLVEQLPQQAQVD
jgi:hypothetical protein